MCLHIEMADSDDINYTIQNTQLLFAPSPTHNHRANDGRNFYMTSSPNPPHWGKSVVVAEIMKSVFNAITTTICGHAQNIFTP